MISPRAWASGLLNFSVNDHRGRALSLSGSGERGLVYFIQPTSRY